MPMEVNRRELKARARERIRASHPAFWKVTLVYLLLTSGVAAVADLAGAARIGLPRSLGYLRPLSRPVGHPVYHGDGSGLSVVALRTYRQQSAGYGTLIDGFSMV